MTLVSDYEGWFYIHDQHQAAISPVFDTEFDALEWLERYNAADMQDAAPCP